MKGRDSIDVLFLEHPKPFRSKMLRDVFGYVFVYHNRQDIDNYEALTYSVCLLENIARLPAAW